MREYKLIVLGAGGVGKSCLTIQYISSQYIDSYDPTIEDSYNKIINIDNRIVELEILDTAGIEQFTAMRELYIKNGDGFILVYSINDLNSFKELLKLRDQILKIKGSEENCLMVLVGNKADLNYMERKVSIQDGIDLSESWGGIPFYETSALLRNNVDEVFVDLVRQIIRKEITDQRKQVSLVNQNNTSNVQAPKNNSNNVYGFANNTLSSLNLQYQNASSGNGVGGNFESYNRSGGNISQHSLAKSGHMRTRSQMVPSPLATGQQNIKSNNMQQNNNGGNLISNAPKTVNTGYNNRRNMTAPAAPQKQQIQKSKNNKKKSKKCVIM
ncbi:ras-domain-containing protein [Hanseniaspora valbyensis NRRL Y-1626]|uniref:Ras-domain-containing protein n=1 Tax=Hanseniaspora valbyensis NRRL Y-1626 TaxID=766949 RepID=A0A1B7TIV4_9ASCO|nr:ras-domain-containing protein [Hanseniaspora valbyensis NRRL Y-1626]